MLLMTRWWAGIWTVGDINVLFIFITHNHNIFPKSIQKARYHLIPVKIFAYNIQNLNVIAHNIIKYNEAQFNQYELPKCLTKIFGIFIK